MPGRKIALPPAVASFIPEPRMRHVYALLATAVLAAGCSTIRDVADTFSSTANSVNYARDAARRLGGDASEAGSEQGDDGPQGQPSTAGKAPTVGTWGDDPHWIDPDDFFICDRDDNHLNVAKTVTVPSKETKM